MTSIRPMTQPSSKTLPTLEMNYFVQTTTHHRKSSQHVDFSHKKPSQHQTRSVIYHIYQEIKFTLKNILSFYPDPYLVTYTAYWDLGRFFSVNMNFVTWYIFYHATSHTLIWSNTFALSWVAVQVTKVWVYLIWQKCFFWNWISLKSVLFIHKKCMSQQWLIFTIFVTFEYLKMHFFKAKNDFLPDVHTQVNSIDIWKRDY